MDIVFIADIFAEDYVGGGELNNEEFISFVLEQTDHVLSTMYSKDVTVDYLKNNKDKKYVIGNFMGLAQESEYYIRDNLEYIIYEHDHKYLTNRNPAMFVDFVAPFEYVIRRRLYENALAVLCQSKLQLDIIYKNLRIDNLINLSGNMWSAEALTQLERLSDKPNDDKYAVLWSNTPHKNTEEAVRYCEYKKLDYDLIYPSDNATFLNKLSDYKGLVFFPKTPETLSRVVVEARMLNLDVIGNDLIGALGEPWFNLKGVDLIEKMLDKKIEICNTILEVFNEDNPNNKQDVK
jgi:hypothetical protein